MNVVFAMQSPTLLNVLATSSSWSLSVAELGDADDLAERRWSAVPVYRGARDDVALVFVCTELQWFRARSMFPAAHIVFVIHNGAPHMTPRHVGLSVLVFSRRVAALHLQRNPSLRVGVVTPSYRPDPTWERWAPRAWALMNRPGPGRSEHLDALLALGEGHDAEFYGQGWERGLLEGKARAELDRACAAYLTPLPPWAGFGLAQHECLARGIPLVGSRWGDMHEEMPQEYTSLSDDFAKQRSALATLMSPSEGPAYAAELSDVGLDMIARTRTQEHMERSVRESLSAWL